LRRGKVIPGNYLHTDGREQVEERWFKKDPLGLKGGIEKNDIHGKFGKHNLVWMVQVNRKRLLDYDVYFLSHFECL
jgi:hypothetical protein